MFSQLQRASSVPLFHLLPVAAASFAAVQDMKDLTGR